MSRQTKYIEIKIDTTIDQIGKVYQFYKNIIKKKS